MREKSKIVDGSAQVHFSLTENKAPFLVGDAANGWMDGCLFDCVREGERTTDIVLELGCDSSSCQSLLFVFKCETSASVKTKAWELRTVRNRSKQETEAQLTIQTVRE